MQESPNSLAQLLRQIMELGAAALMRSLQENATAPCHPQQQTPAITLSVVTAVPLPASMIACPVRVLSDAANDNAEG